MAAPYETDEYEGGRDIASQFNNEQYDTTYEDGTPAERRLNATNPTRPYPPTKVTNVEVDRSVRRRRHSGKMLKAAVIGGSLAAAEYKSRQEDPSGTGYRGKKNQLYFKALRNARRIIKDNQDLFNDGDELLVAQKPPVSPSFPVIIVGLAILKDSLDVLDLSIIGIIFTTIASILVSVILAFWTFGRASGGWWKKRLIKWLVKRFIIMLGLELIPFFKIIPATTIFILMAHYREKKMVKIANLILEELHRAGFVKRIL